MDYGLWTDGVSRASAAEWMVCLGLTDDMHMGRRTSSEALYRDEAAA